jgi:chemotaxis protein CheX
MAGERMNVKFLSSFVEAAYDVLQMETKSKTTRGQLLLEKKSHTTDDVTVILSMIGQAEGIVLYSMDEQTAKIFASTMLGEDFEDFDDLAQSGIAELGNVITGRASMKLSEAGYQANISPPTLLLGAGVRLDYFDIPRYIVPLNTDVGGAINIHLALREGAKIQETNSLVEFYSSW